VDGEAAGDHDLHVRVAGPVQRLADVAHQRRVHPGRLEAAHHRDDRGIDELLAGVESHAVQSGTQCLGQLERGANAVVLEIDQGDESGLIGHVLEVLAAGEHGVAPVGRDQPMRYRADPLAPPP